MRFQSYHASWQRGGAPQKTVQIWHLESLNWHLPASGLCSPHVKRWLSGTWSQLSKRNTSFSEVRFSSRMQDGLFTILDASHPS